MRRILVIYASFVILLTLLGLVVVGGTFSDAVNGGTRNALSTTLYRTFADKDGPAARSAATRLFESERGHEVLGFLDVATAEDFFWYARTTLEAALSDVDTTPKEWDGTSLKELSNRTFLAGAGVLLGQPRLRQWRSKRDQKRCRLVDVCFRDSTFSEDDYASYRWRSGQELDRPGISTKLASRRYPAGSFAIDVPLQNRLAFWETLEADTWIDAATRAVTLDVAVYSGNANLHARVLLFSEFPADGGGAVSSLRIDVARLWPYSKDKATLLFLELICGTFALTFALARFIRRCRHQRRLYRLVEDLLASPWNIFDLALVLLVFAYLGIRLRQPKIDLDQDYVAVDVAFDLARQHQVVLAFACWIAWFRLIEFLRVWKRAAILWLDISTTIADLSVFCVFLVVVCLAFATSQHVLFGLLRREFSSMANAIGFSVGAAFGEISYPDTFTSAGIDATVILTKLFSFLYVLVVLLLLMHLLVAIVTTEKTTRDHIEQYWCLIRLDMIRSRRRGRQTDTAWDQGTRRRQKRWLKELEKRIREDDDVMPGNPVPQRHKSSCQSKADDEDWFAKTTAKYSELTYWRNQEVPGTTWEAEVDAKRKILTNVFDDDMYKEVLGDLDKAKMDALLVMLVLSNVCKITSLTEYIHRHVHQQSGDPDITLRNALTACPFLFPSFLRLNTDLQDTVKRAFSAQLNLGKFINGDPRSLDTVKDALSDENNDMILRFVMVLGLTRIVVEDDFHTVVLHTAWTVLMEIRSLTADAVMELYLSRMGRTYEVPDRFLVRLALIFRVVDRVSNLLEAVARLPTSDRTYLHDELDRDRFDWVIVINPSPFFSHVAQCAPSTRTGYDVGLAVLLALLRRARTFIVHRSGAGVYTLSMHDLLHLAATSRHRNADAVYDCLNTADFSFNHISPNHASVSHPAASSAPGLHHRRRGTTTTRARSSGQFSVPVVRVQ